MSNKQKKPIGWATTLTTLKSDIRLMWSSTMTIEKSPLRKLDPMVAHMLFQVLAYMWSAIFALAFGSIYYFGISAIAHTVIIAGIFITVLTMNEAHNRPQTFNRLKPKDNVINSRGMGGEHE